MLNIRISLLTVYNSNIRFKSHWTWMEHNDVHLYLGNCFLCALVFVCLAPRGPFGCGGALDTFYAFSFDACVCVFDRVNEVINRT